MSLVQSNSNEDKGKHTIGDLKLNLDTQLGRSGSSVFLDIFKNRNVAVKHILCIKNDNLELDRFSLYDKHPNIIRVFGYPSDNHHNYICLELCKCNLDTLISFCSSKKFVADPDYNCGLPTVIHLKPC